MLGIGQQVGRLRPGFAADLVALREDPIANVRALWEVEWVAAAGRRVAAPTERVLDVSAGGGPEESNV